MLGFPLWTRYCFFNCVPGLAISWPEVINRAGYQVSKLRRWRESNNVESYSGIVEQGKAKVRICIGPGTVADVEQRSDDCHLIMMFKYPLFFGKPGAHFQLAVEVERLLLENGAKLPSKFRPLGEKHRRELNGVSSFLGEKSTMAIVWVWKMN